MRTLPITDYTVTKGSDIIVNAEKAGLDLKLLYSVVVDLSTEGLYTANCINMAAGILFKDLGLPRYFFENLNKSTLANLLESIISSMKVIDGRVCLCGNVAQIKLEEDTSQRSQQVCIATEESRDSMEAMLSEMLCGRRREYYYSGMYYTYIIYPERIEDYAAEVFTSSRFLFSVDSDYNEMPEPTRRRYENFLVTCAGSTLPPIEAFNLPETGETRFMFHSDFVSPQLPVLRKLLADHGFVLYRAYWEPYSAKGETPSSICTLYIQGELNRAQEKRIIADLRAFLSYSVDPIQTLYLQGEITFSEMLFAGNCVDFAHLFIFKEKENQTDLEILANLTSENQRDAFARRVHSANRTTYDTPRVREALARYPDLIKLLYTCFEQKFSPTVKERMSSEECLDRKREYDKIITRRFLNDSVGHDIMSFLFKIVTATLKTNFFKPEKRSFSFRFDNSVLDPLVFPIPVYGVFYVNAHYASGTHLRAADIARGGLRLIRVSHANYAEELDNALLLNYALGPKAQRIKHKDICESGSKGVVLPLPQYAKHDVEALNDYTEGIMDLVIADEDVIDYLGRPEMIFFGPDEGTALLMDDIALHAQNKGYRHWRTLTSGKNSGIPHDTYGLLNDGKIFGLLNRKQSGVELQIEGESILITSDMDLLYEVIGNDIDISGMTTTSIMQSFRTLIDHCGARESDLNLMITGGPDGDLGANQTQCYQGKICLVIDGGSVLYDPAGLNKRELKKLAFARHSSPRLNSLAFPADKLSKDGFMVPIHATNIRLPDGTFIEDGALFHRTFLTNESNRRFIQQADIRAFIPCGGFKDTINSGNVKQFLTLFQELEFIVEGANVFFDNASRRYIAHNTPIRQIKDSTANKGGVFSSSLSEVLTAFLFGEDYEKELVSSTVTRWELIRDIILLVKKYSAMETQLLLQLHEQSGTPLFELSEISSEYIFTMQDHLNENISDLSADENLMWNILASYVPQVLIDKLGRPAILRLFGQEYLVPYRNAIITKKAASTAFYRHGNEWDSFMRSLNDNMQSTLRSLFAGLPVSA